MPPRLTRPLRRKRAWAISIATVLFAGAAIVLLPRPEARAVHTPAAPPSVVTPAPAVLAPLGSPVHLAELDGPGVDGSFALATNAVRAGGPSELFAELRLIGLGAEDAPHVPVSLVVVLDRSGSMEGEKLASARESIVTLLDAMADEDRLAVVAYDDVAELVQPLAPARVLRRSLPDRIRRLGAGGGTNIPAGLAMGMTALREAPEGTAQRMILVSDGRDGSGLSLADVAAQVDRAAGDRVITSSLGVGLDYDSAFMTRVADAGRGNYAFLQHGAELDSFLRRELEETTSTVAEEVAFEVAMPEGVAVRAVHGAVAAHSGRTVRVDLGALFAGERRKVVFELESTGGRVSEVIPLEARLVYRSVDDEHTAHLAAGTVAAAIVATDEEVAAAQDDELYPDALATVLDAQQEVALAAWRSGDRARAREASSGAIARYRRASHRHVGSAVISSRISAVDAEMERYEALDPASESGRAFDLGVGSSRHEAMAGF
jgi:Ca-activated chloride channel family protein